MSKSREVKFQVASDLHLENGLHDLVLTRYAPYLILAGDIGCLKARDKNSALKEDKQKLYGDWLKKQCSIFEIVYLVLGNNEPKNTSIEECRNYLDRLSLEIEKHPDPAGVQGRLVFLHHNRSRVFVAGTDIIILGDPLWSKISQKYGKITSSDAGITDTVADRRAGVKNNAFLHNARHKISINWIRTQVDRIRKSDDEKVKNSRILIITHYTPTLVGTNAPERDACKAANWSTFQNDILGGEGINGLGQGDAWVFGHTHFTTNFEQDEVRVFSNQKGRSMENLAFKQDNLLIMVPREGD